MVGRKITEEEASSRGLAFEEAHNVSRTVFHESGEQFSQGIKRDEGTVKHFARHFYLPVIMVCSVFIGVKLYQESFKFLMTYEDYLDWVVF